MPSPQPQVVRYLRTSDAQRLAWAEMGDGAPLVKAANWLSHLEFDRESPVWRHWIAFFGGRFRFIRYDERGCGMSAGLAEDLSLDRRVRDLEDVLGAAGVREPVTLLGISQGAATCIEFAARHPERVKKLILYGGYARGFAHLPDSPSKTEWRAIIDLARVSWAKDNPAFRSVFTSQFIPDGTDEHLRWMNDLCRRSSSGPTAARLLAACGDVDVTARLTDVSVPTIVVHASGDLVAPLSAGRQLAAGIRGAEFVELDSRNHVLLEDEPAWKRFTETVLRFTGSTPPPDHEPFFDLTPRQRQILALLVQGHSNSTIGDELGISEKTVRNHLSALFDKLGVSSRAQAIVLARDREFDPG